MWIAHYASGLIAKPFAPNVPLSVLALAGAFPDALFFMLNMLGVESFDIKSKIIRKGGCFPYEADYPWSHSLAGMAVAGALLAAIWASTSKKKTTPQDYAAIILASMSHFLLEVPTHRHDTKILPNDNIELGMGLFDYPSATLAVELAIFFTGLWVYHYFAPNATKAGYNNSGKQWKIYAISLFMIIQQVHFCFGSAPTYETRWVHAPLFLFNILTSCWALGTLEA